MIMHRHSRNKYVPFLTLAVITSFVLSSCALLARPATQPAQAEVTVAPAAAAGEPIIIGVSGSLTGQNARYGEQWKKGFDLALEEINGKGGINGRRLEYVFEDSQSDPKQSVVIAQKFVADPRFIIELGDFSSGASMAASPIYQRAGLVQFGFTNSHPDFTKTGDATWSNSTTQDQLSPAQADFAVTDVSLKKLAVLNLNTDWGKTTTDLFNQRAKELGAQIVAVGSVLPDDQRPEVKSVVDKYKTKYNETPDFFAIHAYDTINLIAKAIEVGGPTREGVKAALPQLKDVPSVIYGKVSFNSETRRVEDPSFANLVVKDGQFVAWDEKK